MDGRRRAALVTGAGRPEGLAAAASRALAEDGWTLALTAWGPYDRSSAGRAGDLVGELSAAGAEVHCSEADLADPAAPARVLDLAEGAVGPLSALVTAHAHSRRGGLLETSIEDFDTHMAVNARASLLLCAEFARRWRTPFGRIVNFVSGPPLGGEIAYAASKGAVEWITLSAAAELAPRGITVNAVDPGPNDTGWMSPELYARIERDSPMGRVGLPEDVAGLVAWLCSERSGWITGQVLRCDGGWSSLRG